MTEDFLDEIDDDLDDVMDDILDASMEDLSEVEFEGILDMDDPGPDDKQSVPGSEEGRLKGVANKILGAKKLLILIGAGVLFLILAVAGSIFFFSGGDEIVEGTPAGDIRSGSDTGATTEAPEIIFDDIIDLEPFERIPLKGSSTMRWISLNLSLELTDHQYRKQVYTMEEPIRQIVTAQMAEMTWLELRNPEGKIRLKYDLLKQINAVFSSAMVRNIYFTHLVMQ